MRTWTIPATLSVWIMCLLVASCSETGVSGFYDGDLDKESETDVEFEADDFDTTRTDDDIEPNSVENDTDEIDFDKAEETESDTRDNDIEEKTEENDIEIEVDKDIDIDAIDNDSKEEDSDSEEISRQWESIHPPSRLNGDFLAAIIPSDSEHWLAFGESIATSSNQGTNWQSVVNNSLPRQVNQYYDYYDIEFASVDTAFFAAKNELFKTTNAGISWQLVLEVEQSHPSYIDSSTIYALDFPNPQVGYLVGGFDKIFKTINGGDTWTTLRWNDSTQPYRRYSDVVFLDEQTGFVTGYQVHNISMNFGFEHFIMITTDGGENWESHIIETTGDYKGLELQVIDTQTLFVRLHNTQSSEKVVCSLDGGRNWSEYSAESNLEDVESMYWFDGEQGLIFGKDSPTRTNHLLRTTDRGQNWTAIPLPFNGPLTDHSIMDMAFIDAQSGFAVGQGGAIFTTSDGGLHWGLANQGHPEFYSIGFDTNERGFLSTGTGYYRSNDGGFNWDYATGSESIYVFNMSVGPQGVYLGGIQNHITRIDPDTEIATRIMLPISFFYMYYMDQSSDALFLAGTVSSPYRHNAFLISTDQGENFDVHEIDTEGNGLIGIEYRSGVFFATTTSELLVSLDGGENWDLQYSFSPDIVRHTEFFDTRTGIATLVDGQILKTEDQGISWVVIDAELPDINGLFTADNQTMFAFGQRKNDYGYIGTIWKTEDRGSSWEQDPLPVLIESSLKSMTANENYLYTTGGNGEILRLRKPL